MAFTKEEVRSAITEQCDNLLKMLLQKNEAYGNSAFDPIRCFSKAGILEQINIRLDDKISRLMRGENAGEDTELDIAGYIMLKKAAIHLGRKRVSEMPRAANMQQWVKPTGGED